ncbi:MAG TPA: hypothetical protein VI548_09425, partial [Chitinophagaceae bacterium]|nr:hypothetical protein [Chitinophagaceae bacterium]
EEQNKAKESGALTLLLGKNNVVYYYEGQLLPDASNFETTTFKGIREIIINKKKAVQDTHQHDSSCEEIWKKYNGDKNSCRDKDLVIVIKPDDEATFKNTVDILDEMTINEVKRFAMVELFPIEKELIQKTDVN